MAASDGTARGRWTASIQGRLFALVLVAVIPAFAIQVYSAIVAYQERTRQVREEALRLAQFVAGELARIVDANRALMVAMANLPGVLARDEDACANFASQLQAVTPGVLGLSAFDRNGTLFCISRPQTTAGLSAQARDYADRPWYSEVREAQDFIVSGMVTSRLAGAPVLPLALPMRDAQGAFNGAVVAGLDLRWLNAYFAAKTPPPAGSIGVTDRQGRLLVRVPPLPSSIGTPLGSNFTWLLTAPRPGVSSGVGLDGIDRIFAYTAPDSPALKDVIVYVGVGRDAAMAAVRHATWRNALLLFGAFGLAMLAASLGGRRFVTRPVAALAEAARRWSAGEVWTRVAVAEPASEIGRLGTAFNGMAATIESREQELRGAIAVRDAALEHQRLLTAELNHRVKNTLATVQSIAHLSLRDAGNGEAVEEFSNRLIALSRAHDVLTRGHWSAAAMHDIARAALEPIDTAGADRLRLDGPPARLAPRAALAVAMGLHELATNALKHGALSAVGGKVEVAWTIDPQARHLILRWRESGGPPVASPTRRGFGLRLLERLLSGDLGGSVSLDFQPDGVTCVIEARLDDQETVAVPSEAGA